MSLPIIFRPAAQTELDEAAAWYNNQRPGLGVDFTLEVCKVLDKIAAQPDRCPIVRGTVREAPVYRFPYAIYYRVVRGRVQVIAVFHCARDPQIWQRRS